MAVSAATLSVLPATAAGSDGVTTVQHVRRVSLHESASRAFGQHHRVGTDLLRHGGRTVGYDSFTEHISATRDLFRFALALRHGQIVGRVVRQSSGGAITGPIVFGTGRFAGISGTARLRIDPNKPRHQVLVLHYTL